MNEHFVRGTQFLVDGRAREAVVCLELAAADQPDDFATLYNLVVAFSAVGLRKRALEACPRMIATAPWNGRACLLYANVLAFHERYEDSNAYLKAARLLAPTDALIAACAGRARLVAGDLSGIDVLEPMLASDRCLLPEVSMSAVVGEVLEAEGYRGTPVESRRSLCAEPYILSCQGVSKEVSKSKRTQVAATGSVEISVAAAAEKIANARSIVAITGAGLSAPSGLRTRKDLWNQFDRDEAVSVWRARENPAFLWNVIREFLGTAEHRPNPGHDALAKLPNLIGVVTQNIDRLHDVAAENANASHSIVELHGSFLSTSCWECGKPSRSCFAWVKQTQNRVPTCRDCGGALRPDVVLFGEPVLRERLEAAKRLVKQADLVLVIGCAMDVMPASELPNIAALHGAPVIEFKRSASRLGKRMKTYLVRGCASMTLPELIQKLAKERTSNEA